MKRTERQRGGEGGDEAKPIKLIDRKTTAAHQAVLQKRHQMLMY